MKNYKSLDPSQDTTAPQLLTDEELEAVVDAMSRGGCAVDEETIQNVYGIFSKVRAQNELLNLIIEGHINICKMVGPEDFLLTLSDSGHNLLESKFPWLRPYEDKDVN